MKICGYKKFSYTSKRSGELIEGVELHQLIPLTAPGSAGYYSDRIQIRDNVLHTSGVTFDQIVDAYENQRNVVVEMVVNQYNNKEAVSIFIV